jgi:hypothetical protein
MATARARLALYPELVEALRNALRVLGIYVADIPMERARAALARAAEIESGTRKRV